MKCNLFICLVTDFYFIRKMCFKAQCHWETEHDWWLVTVMGTWGESWFGKRYFCKRQLFHLLKSYLARMILKSWLCYDFQALKIDVRIIFEDERLLRLLCCLHNLVHANQILEGFSRQTVGTKWKYKEFCFLILQGPGLISGDWV